MAGLAGRAVQLVVIDGCRIGETENVVTAVAETGRGDMIVNFPQRNDPVVTAGTGRGDLIVVDSRASGKADHCRAVTGLAKHGCGYVS